MNSSIDIVRFNQMDLNQSYLDLNTSIFNSSTDHDIQSLKRLFTVWDYLVLMACLVVSAIIGSSNGISKIVFGDRKEGSKASMVERLSTGSSSKTSACEGSLAPKSHPSARSETRAYFGGQVGFGPVTLSLIASRISPLTTIGFPVEVYLHGMSIWFFVIGEFLGCLFAAVFFLPILHPLKFGSVYELLQHRFDSKTLRRLCSFLYALKMVMYLGVVLYGPAVALSSVTPLSIDASILACGAVCALYTSVGGLVGVIWSDVFQVSIIILTQFLVLGYGLWSLGFWPLWEFGLTSGRVKLPTTKLDLHSRHSFWNIILAPTLEWGVQMGTEQMSLQRLKCLASGRQAAASLVITGLSVVVITSAAMATGLVMTAHFVDCDPLLQGIISDENQYLPYLVIKLFGAMPGVTGLFVAGIFSASLSSISSGVNSVANVLWDDFLKLLPRLRNFSSRTILFLVRILSLLTGFVPVAIAFAAKGFGDNVQKMGTVFVAVSMGATNAVFISCFFQSQNQCEGSDGGKSGKCRLNWLVGPWWNSLSTTCPQTSKN